MGGESGPACPARRLSGPEQSASSPHCPARITRRGSRYEPGGSLNRTSKGAELLVLPRAVGRSPQGLPPGGRGWDRAPRRTPQIRGGGTQDHAMVPIRSWRAQDVDLYDPAPSRPDRPGARDSAGAAAAEILTVAREERRPAPGPRRRRCYPALAELGGGCRPATRPRTRAGSARFTQTKKPW